MLSHKMDFNCCANRDSFRIDSHIYKYVVIIACYLISVVICKWLLKHGVHRQSNKK